ncbi:MAG: hypothetical protein HQL39_18775 [Alphaproteobacteria bacterium]|nr:hypothetical protein [Alphaproteobacteria bacterium]
MKHERYRQELGKRLEVVTGRFASKTAAASAAGVSVEQFNKWLAGKVKVPAEALWELATIADVDFCWLCGGQQPPAPRVQPEVLREVLAAMLDVMAAEGLAASSPDKFAETCIALHDYVRDQRGRGDSPVDFAALAAIIRLAAR